MPVPNSTSFGNLILKFDIEFPKLKKNDLEMVEAVLENNFEKFEAIQSKKASWSNLVGNLIVSPLRKIVDYSKDLYDRLFLTSKL